MLSGSDSKSVDFRKIERDLLARNVEAAIKSGELEAATRQASEAAEIYRVANDTTGRALAFYLLGKCWRRQNDLPASLAGLQKSYELYESESDWLGGAHALLAKGVTLRLMGRDPEAIHDLKQSRELYRQFGERAQEMHTLMSLSSLYKQSGNIAASQAMLYECLDYFEQAEQTSEVVSDIAKVLMNIANNYGVLEDSAEMIHFATRGIRLLETAGDWHYLSMAWGVLGSAYLLQADYETALLHLRKALQIAEQVGIQWAIAMVLDDISTALMHQNLFEEAKEVMERCLRINNGDANRLVYCGNLTQMGQLYAHPENAGRDAGKALAYLGQARQIAEEQDAIMLLVEIHKALSDLYEFEGDFRLALAAFRDLYKVEKRLFNEESDKRIRALELDKAQKDAEIAHLRSVELAEALAEAERLRALAEEHARIDSLTQVLNRRALDEFIEEESERSRRNKRPLSIALVDIDYFKRINDSFGHGVGDETLRQTALILRTHSHGDVAVARYGGEEFALVFPNTGLVAALALCEHLRKEVEAHEWTAIHPKMDSVTISAGVSVMEFGNAGEVDDRDTQDARSTVAASIAEADKNLYIAKHGGRNLVIG